MIIYLSDKIWGLCLAAKSYTQFLPCLSHNMCFLYFFKYNAADILYFVPGKCQVPYLNSYSLKSNSSLPYWFSLWHRDPFWFYCPLFNVILCFLLSCEPMFLGFYLWMPWRLDWKVIPPNTICVCSFHLTLLKKITWMKSEIWKC